MENQGEGSNILAFGMAIRALVVLIGAPHTENISNV